MKKSLLLIAAALSAFSGFHAESQTVFPVTASEMTDLIIMKTGSAPVQNTVDVFKAGDPRTRVTGVITCMFATMDVLKKAVEMKCNLIIPHEPLYYNHLDETRQFRDDPVYLEKKRFIEENNLVVWRFHDYIHNLKPDGIDYGMIRKIGWLDYLDPGQSNRLTMPETSLGNIIKHLKKVFPSAAINVVGDPEMNVSRIMYAAGAPGPRVHFAMLRDPDVELVIGGEVPQWETYEYVRDAIIQGKKKAIIFLGHIPSEDAGMEFAAEWMRGFISTVPVKFVESGYSYRTY